MQAGGTSRCRKQTAKMSDLRAGSFTSKRACVASSSSITIFMLSLFILESAAKAPLGYDFPERSLVQIQPVPRFASNVGLGRVTRIAPSEPEGPSTAHNE